MHIHPRTRSDTHGNTHSQPQQKADIICTISYMCFFAEVEDIVHAVLYLLSDKADMINGITLHVDGGYSVA